MSKIVIIYTDFEILFCNISILVTNNYIVDFMFISVSFSVGVFVNIQGDIVCGIENIVTD
ncbi:MAG: hypothetical protein K5927_02980 [Lachnospiraceae bacterium]|nr:hypothetical protein [Lachnospiraceae bacterium]